MAFSGSQANPLEAPGQGGALLTPRGAVALMFAAFGIGAGLWSGASGAILLRAGVNPGAFGAALTANVAFYLLAMSSVGRLARAIPTKNILVICAPLLGFSYAALLSASTVMSFSAALVLCGLFAGFVDLTMNAEGTKVETQLRRPILAGLHGVVSAAIGVSALAGGFMANSALTWLAGLIVAAALIAASAVIALGLPEVGLESASDRRLGSSRQSSPTLTLIGVVIGVSIACETSAMWWSALLLQTEAPSLAEFSGLGVAFFALCQSVMRLNADRLRRRFDDRRLMIASLGVAMLGLMIVAAHQSFSGAVLGFAIIGIGTGAVVPCGFAMAAREPGVTPSAALSAVARYGALVRLPAPLAVGLIASMFSLSTAFAIFIVLLAGALIALIGFMPPAAPKILS